jgi:CRP/FNR family transcriptional regulator, cyclic AMP receptor protein
LRKKATASFEPKTFLAKVGDGKAVSKYQKGQIIFSQGDSADAVFYILNGKIKLTVVSKRGKEAVVGLLGLGHFFGEGCLNGHPLRITTATAMEECLFAEWKVFGAVKCVPRFRTRVNSRPLTPNKTCSVLVRK